MAEGEYQLVEPTAGGPLGFLMCHTTDPEVERANDTARVFLGMNIQCAQCHDAPEHVWKRQQFHELAAFFGRLTYRVDPNGKNNFNFITTLVVKPNGEYQTPDAYDATIKTATNPNFFLTGCALTANASDMERRQALADYVTDGENYYFAAAMANRVWGRLMGQAFTQPVDDLGPIQHTTYPQVLLRLAASFRASEYDIRALYRTIMNSQAYQRLDRLPERTGQHLHFAATCPAPIAADVLWNSLANVLGPVNGDQFLAKKSATPLREPSSTSPKKKSATSSPTSEDWLTRPPSSSDSTPRKRLFPPPTNPQSDKPFQNKGPEDHTINTINGRITLLRRRYHDSQLGSIFPLDTWIDQLEDTVSLGVREMACRLNLASRNFDKAAENLGRAGQIHLSGELLRQVVESEGKAVQKEAQAKTLPVTWQAKDCKALNPDGKPTEQSRVYLGADGVMAPIITQKEKDGRRKKTKEKRRRRGKKCQPLPRAKKGADGPYKEYKIVTLYDDTADHRTVSVTRGDCEVAGRIMRRDAARVGLDQADDKVAVIDGADWIRNQIQAQSLNLDGVLLDFYHLSENVHKARRAVYGEADPKDEQNAGNQWVKRILHQAKHEGYAALAQTLGDWVKELRRGKKKAGKSLLNYVSERKEMVLYPEFQAVGRQIGSGPTEAMCKATTQRVKGVGKRWDGDNVEALMALEALDQSGGWQAYWKSLLTPRA